jgi:hypothetical protein
MSNDQVTTYKLLQGRWPLTAAGGALTPTEKSSHPSESGRVSAWVKRTKNDLALVKDMYGHPPSIVSEPPADKSIIVATDQRLQIHQ